MKKKFVAIMMVAAMAASMAACGSDGVLLIHRKGEAAQRHQMLQQGQTTCVVQPSAIKQLNRRA